MSSSRILTKSSEHRREGPWTKTGAGRTGRRSQAWQPSNQSKPPSRNPLEGRADDPVRFVLWDKLKPGRAGRGHRDQDDDDAAEGNTKSIPRDDGPPPKKPRSEGEPANDEQGADGGGPSKRQQKKRGANKARQFARTSDEVKLCASAAAGQECTRSKPTEAAPPANEGETGKGKGRRRRGWDEGCRFSHDVEAYLASKPADILSHLDTNFAALPSTDFTFPTPTADVDDPDKPIPVPRPTTVPRCPLLVATGQCPFGYRCRFLSAHQDPSSALSTDPDRREAYLSSLTTTDPRNGRRLEWTDRGEINSLGLQPLRSLRKRKYPLAGAKEYMDSIGQPMDQREGHKQGKRWRNGEQKEAEEEEDQDEAGEGEVDAKEEPTANGEAGPTANGDAAVNGESHAHAKSLDVDLARARPSERPRLQHWRATGQNLYLAPLTTVGNLPFRRLASSLGADITCGEMALGQDLMAGSGSEWSLVRRYKGEGCFGAQIAGSRPQVLVPTAEILSKECYLDFVDVNCGCPWVVLRRQLTRLRVRFGRFPQHRPRLSKRCRIGPARPPQQARPVRRRHESRPRPSRRARHDQAPDRHPRVQADGPQDLCPGSGRVGSVGHHGAAPDPSRGELSA